jgi:hypothetical protein
MSYKIYADSLIQDNNLGRSDRCGFHSAIIKADHPTDLDVAMCLLFKWLDIKANTYPYVLLSHTSDIIQPHYEGNSPEDYCKTEYVHTYIFEIYHPKKGHKG